MLCQMKSIVWKFTERGAVVKVINKNCPEVRRPETDSAVWCAE